MRVLIYSAPVEDVYGALSPETDLRSADFYHAVLERAITQGSLEVETDGVDVAVFGAPAE